MGAGVTGGTLAAFFDYLLHRLPSSGQQWTFSCSGQKPHPFVLVATIENVHAIIGQRVMKGRAAVFGDELEVDLPPRIIDEREKLFPKILQFIIRDGTNGFRDRFASLFIQTLKIDFIEGHTLRGVW